MQAWVFPGLVVIARAKHPAPFRTRPLSAAAPMVLRLKTWESRSPPNLERPTKRISLNDPNYRNKQNIAVTKRISAIGAGWSSPVARQAHNLKVVGSNPTPATKYTRLIKDFKAEHNARFLSFQILVNTWSTFYEPPIDGQHDRAERGNHAAALHAGSSQAQISAVTSASGRPSRAVPSE